MVSRSFLNFCACDLESGPCVVSAWKSQTLPWKSHTFLWRSRILLSSRPALLWKRDSQSMYEKQLKAYPWIWWNVFLFHVWAGSCLLKRRSLFSKEQMVRGKNHCTFARLGRWWIRNFRDCGDVNLVGVAQPSSSDSHRNNGKNRPRILWG